MDTLKSMRVFATVAASGSFAAAATRLDISRAMASKHVLYLEERLGTRLLQRTTRKLGLTDSGTAYYERCVKILEEIDEAESGAVKLSVTPRGVLRLTMPVSFSVRHVGPLMTRYLEKFPEVQIDATVSDRRIDLIDEGLDLAIRVGLSLEPGLIARRLASDRVVICGAPAYLERYGRPTKPEDLAAHNCVLYSYSAAGSEWKMTGPDGEHTVKVTGNMRANNGDLLNQVVLSGGGLMCQPEFLVGEDIRAGRLEEVLKEYACEPLGIYAVFPSRKHLSAKTRTFVDFLVDNLAYAHNPPPILEPKVPRRD
jgi:DNA-binding transcriptional LysR family regulator